jgi:preprotein translocase subunit SecF
LANFITRLDYMKYAKLWLVLSIVLTIASLAAIVRVQGGQVQLLGGLNKGIDFTGGLQMEIQYPQKVTSQQVEGAVTKVASGAQVQNTEPKGPNVTPETTAFFVKVPKEISVDDRAKLMTELESLGAYQKVGEEEVSGTISDELAQSAAMALAIATVLQIIYIWIRFEFKFGITAVAALLHDLVITLGLMAIFQVQVNASFVAAILTVLGYSMNDTVVVIDRIRENLQQRRKGENWQALTTRSIQEVITRSLFTGVSVQTMLLAMLLWGGDTLWDFSMTLLIGVTAGTYSSIFIASALWLFWQQYDEKHKNTPGTAKPAKA